MQHSSLDKHWYASPNTPKTADRVQGRSIVWTEDAALLDTECCHPDCERPTADDTAPLPLCERHATIVLYWSMREIRAHVDAAAATLADIAAIQPPADPTRRSVIYYARVDTTIKIGTTTPLAKRMKQLGADLLAYESGSYDIEAQRHREHAMANSHNEFFHPSPELVGWIKILRGEAAAA